MGERSLEALDVTWARTAPARVLRGSVLMGLLGPAMDFYTRRTVLGLEHFEGLKAPVVFVANHSSHMDTPAILRALPHAWRRRTVVAAAADYFYSKRRIAYPRLGVLQHRPDGARRPRPRRDAPRRTSSA